MMPLLLNLYNQKRNHFINQIAQATVSVWNTFANPKPVRGALFNNLYAYRKRRPV